MQMQLFAGLAPEAVADVHAATERIKLRMKRTAEDIIAIGQDLIAVKAKLGHGRFGEWLTAEFGMTDRTAQRFMQVADAFGAKSDTVSLLPLKALYELAAPSTPEPVRQDAVAAVEAGETVTAKDVQEWKRKYKDALVEADRAKAEKDEADVTRSMLQEQIHVLNQQLDEARNASVREVVSPELQRRVKDLERDLAEAEGMAERYGKTIGEVYAERDELKDRLAELLELQKNPPPQIDPAVVEAQIQRIRQDEEARLFVKNFDMQAKVYLASVRGAAAMVANAKTMTQASRAQVADIVKALQEAAGELSNQAADFFAIPTVQSNVVQMRSLS